MDHAEIIQALLGGDCLHIRDMAEAQRLGRPAEAVLAAHGRVSMAHAQRAVKSPLVRVEEQVRPWDAPKNWTPDGVCYIACEKSTS